MPNRSYEKGRRAEQRIVRDAKASGAVLAVRTAGSKSPYDVIVIKKKNYPYEGFEVLLVQVKGNKHDAKAAAKKHNHLFPYVGVIKEVYAYIEKGKWQEIVINKREDAE